MVSVINTNSWRLRCEGGEGDQLESPRSAMPALYRIARAGENAPIGICHE